MIIEPKKRKIRTTWTLSYEGFAFLFDVGEKDCEVIEEKATLVCKNCGKEAYRQGKSSGTLYTLDGLAMECKGTRPCPHCGYDKQTYPFSNLEAFRRV